MKICMVFLIGFSVASANVTLQEIVKANNLFTPDVYKKFTLIKNENFMASPFSAEIILALTQSGCKGETAEEVRNALHLPNSAEKIEKGLKALLPTIKGNDLYTLHSANKMYVQENFRIKETFKVAATEVYHAEIENIDFVKNETAAKTMNDWVEKKTQNKIQNLVDPRYLNEDTRAVLINALYFKANWLIHFDSRLTKKRKFYKNSQNVIEVDMMHHYKQIFNYYDSLDLNAKFLELPFVGEDASMVFVLPNEKEGLSSLENQIENVFIPQNFSMKFVNVAIPKFKIETKIDMKNLLINLGVEKIFDSNQADLSGIGGKKGDLFVDKVVQKTFIDVNEGGVEAAAATYVLIEDRLAVLNPPEFIADHPFIFYIKLKNIIAFAGKVVLPNTE